MWDCGCPGEGGGKGRRTATAWLSHLPVVQVHGLVQHLKQVQVPNGTKWPGEQRQNIKHNPQSL